MDTGSVQLNLTLDQYRILKFAVYEEIRSLEELKKEFDYLGRSDEWLTKRLEDAKAVFRMISEQMF